MSTKQHFQEICKDFRGYHTNSLNVAIHLITTPLCFIAAAGMLNLVTGTIFATSGVALVYAFFTGFAVPLGLYVASLILLLGIVAASAVIVSGPVATLSLKSLGLLFLGAYIAQEMAHWITGEKTFQGSYMGKSNWVTRLAWHTWYLLPLCLDATMHMKNSFLAWMLPLNYVVFTKLHKNEDVSQLRTLHDWVMAQ